MTKSRLACKIRQYDKYKKKISSCDGFIRILQQKILSRNADVRGEAAYQPKSTLTGKEIVIWTPRLLFSDGRGVAAFQPKSILTGKEIVLWTPRYTATKDHLRKMIEPKTSVLCIESAHLILMGVKRCPFEPLKVHSKKQAIKNQCTQIVPWQPTYLTVTTHNTNIVPEVLKVTTATNSEYQLCPKIMQQSGPMLADDADHQVTRSYNVLVRGEKEKEGISSSLKNTEVNVILDFDKDDIPRSLRPPTTAEHKVTKFKSKRHDEEKKKRKSKDIKLPDVPVKKDLQYDKYYTSEAELQIPSQSINSPKSLQSEEVKKKSSDNIELQLFNKKSFDKKKASLTTKDSKGQKTKVVLKTHAIEHLEEKRESSKPLAAEDVRDGSKAEERGISGCDVFFGKKVSPSSKDSDTFDLSTPDRHNVQPVWRLLTKPKDPSLDSELINKSTNHKKAKRKGSRASQRMRSEEELPSKDTAGSKTECEGQFFNNKPKGRNRRHKPLILPDENPCSQNKPRDSAYIIKKSNQRARQRNHNSHKQINDNARAEQRSHLPKESSPPPLDEQHFPSLPPLHIKCGKPPTKKCEKKAQQRTPDIESLECNTIVVGRADEIIERITPPLTHSACTIELQLQENKICDEENASLMSQNSQEPRQKASSINDPGKEKKEASAPLTVEDSNDSSKHKRNIPGYDVIVEEKTSPPSKKSDKIEICTGDGETVQQLFRLLTKPKDPAVLGDTLVKSETRRNKSKRKSKSSSSSRSQEELSSKDGEERLIANKTKGNKRRFSKPFILSDESTCARPEKFDTTSGDINEQTNPALSIGTKKSLRSANLNEKRSQCSRQRNPFSYKQLLDNGHAEKITNLRKQPAPPPLDNQHFPSLSPLDYNTKCSKAAENICKKNAQQKTDKCSSGDVSAGISKKVSLHKDTMISHNAPPVNEEHYPVLSPANGPSKKIKRRQGRMTK